VSEALRAPRFLPTAGSELTMSRVSSSVSSVQRDDSGLSCAVLPLPYASGLRTRITCATYFRQAAGLLDVEVGVHLVADVGVGQSAGEGQMPSGCLDGLGG